MPTPARQTAQLVSRGTSALLPVAGALPAPEMHLPRSTRCPGLRAPALREKRGALPLRLRLPRLPLCGLRAEPQFMADPDAGRRRRLPENSWHSSLNESCCEGAHGGTHEDERRSGGEKSRGQIAASS